MQLECELCGAHYKADISDAHVEGGRLAFTCRSCGREVVVIGGPGERVRRAGSLLPDQADETADGSRGAGPSADQEPPGPRERALPAEEPGDVFGGEGDWNGLPPAAGIDVPPPPADPAPSGEPPAEPVEAAVPVDPVAPAPADDPGAGRVERPGAAGDAAPVISVPEKKGVGPLVLALGGVAVAAVVFAVFVRPMLSAKQDVPASPRPAIQASPAVPAASTPTAPPAEPSPSPAAAPTPGKAPVIEVRELRTPEPKPTPPAAAKKEPAARDAAAVIDPGAIEEAFVRARPLYRLCAVTEAKRDPDGKLGSIVASLTIGPAGAVTRVAFDRPEMASSALGECVRDALQKMTFPAFEGSPVVLRRPISLEVPAGR